MSETFKFKYKPENIKGEVKLYADFGEVLDTKGNKIYYENNHYWEKWGYNSKEQTLYYEDSAGYWEKYDYDSEGNRVYYEDSDGCWEKHKYDLEGNRVYYEDSRGYWLKYENGKKIEHSRGKYYIDGKRAKLKKSINLDDLELI